MALRRNTPAAPPATGRGNAAGPRGAKATPSGAKAAPSTGRGARAGAAGSGKGAGKGADPKAPKTSRMERVKQIIAVFRMTQQRDPKMLPWLLLAVLAPLAVGIVLGIVLGSIVLFTVLGLIVGLFLGLNVFSRRVQKTAYAEIEGKPGAAAGVIDRMRGDWRLTAPVQVNRNQDLVSRVVCRAGVVLIAEGRGRGPRDLLGAEVRRVKKVIGDAPLHDIIIGNGPGEVPLPKLQNTLMRKPRALKKDQVNALDRRLKALGGAAMPLPKGPMPKSVPRGGKTR